MSVSPRRRLCATSTRPSFAGSARRRPMARESARDTARERVLKRSPTLRRLVEHRDHALDHQRLAEAIPGARAGGRSERTAPRLVVEELLDLDPQAHLVLG